MDLTNLDDSSENNKAFSEQTPASLSANTPVVPAITASEACEQLNSAPKPAECATGTAAFSAPAKTSPLSLASHEAGVSMREQAISRAVSITGLDEVHQDKLKAMGYVEFSKYTGQNPKKCLECIEKKVPCSGATIYWRCAQCQPTNNLCSITDHLVGCVVNAAVIDVRHICPSQPPPVPRPASKLKAAARKPISSRCTATPTSSSGNSTPTRAKYRPTSIPSYNGVVKNSGRAESFARNSIYVFGAPSYAGRATVIPVPNGVAMGWRTSQALFVHDSAPNNVIANLRPARMQPQASPGVSIYANHPFLARIEGKAMGPQQRAGCRLPAYLYDTQPMPSQQSLPFATEYGSKKPRLALGIYPKTPLHNTPPAIIQSRQHAATANLLGQNIQGQNSGHSESIYANQICTVPEATDAGNPSFLQQPQEKFLGRNIITNATNAHVGETMMATMQVPLPPKPPAYRHPAKDVPPSQRALSQGVERTLRNVSASVATVHPYQASYQQIRPQHTPGLLPPQLVRNLPHPQQRASTGVNQLQQQAQQATKSIYRPPAIIPARQPTINNTTPIQGPTWQDQQAQRVGTSVAPPVPLTQHPQPGQPLASVPVPLAIPTTNDPRAISFIPQPPPRRGSDEAAAHRPLQPWEIQERLLQQKKASRKPFCQHTPAWMEERAKAVELPVDTFTLDGWSKVESILGKVNEVRKFGYDANVLREAWLRTHENNIRGKPSEEGLSPEQCKAVRFWNELFEKSGENVIPPSDALHAVSVVIYIKKVVERETLTGRKILPGAVQHSIWLLNRRAYNEFAIMNQLVGDISHGPYPGFPGYRFINLDGNLNFIPPQQPVIPSHHLHQFAVARPPPPPLPVPVAPAPLNFGVFGTTSKENPIILDDDSDSEKDKNKASEKEKAVERKLSVEVADGITIVREKISSPTVDIDEIQVTGHNRISVDPPSPNMSAVPQPLPNEQAKTAETEPGRKCTTAKFMTKTPSWCVDPMALVYKRGAAMQLARPRTPQKGKEEKTNKKRGQEQTEEASSHPPPKRGKPAAPIQPPTPPDARSVPSYSRSTTIDSILPQRPLPVGIQSMPSLTQIAQAQFAAKAALKKPAGQPTAMKKPQPISKGLMLPFALPTPPASQSPELALAPPVAPKPPSPIPEPTSAQPERDIGKDSSDAIFGDEDDDEDMASLFGDDDGDEESATQPEPQSDKNVDEGDDLEDLMMAAFDEHEDMGGDDLEKELMAAMGDSGDESSDADDDEVR